MLVLSMICADFGLFLGVADPQQVILTTVKTATRGETQARDGIMLPGAFRPEGRSCSWIDRGCPGVELGRLAGSGGCGCGKVLSWLLSAVGSRWLSCGYLDGYTAAKKNISCWQTVYNTAGFDIYFTCPLWLEDIKKGAVMAPKPLTQNTLFYGDNLAILREYIPTESVDLIYLDPPFNSNRSYNVLFKEESGEESESQITAFEDAWHWNVSAESTYRELVVDQAGRVGDMIAALRQFIGSNQMMAYLVMMAARLVELHRVLKPTGSLYLHCDPTASHYLKVVLDSIFGVHNFKNDISWTRTVPKSDFRQGATNWPRVHDCLLSYHKEGKAGPIFNQPFSDYNLEYIKSSYPYTDAGTGRKYGIHSLTAPGAGSRGHPKYEFMGVTRYWRYSQEKMEKLQQEGRIVQTKPGNVPRYKRYLDEVQGVPVGDMWNDISMVQSSSKERLGYPTQKPLALLERIIQASSNPGDVVMDPFCGCGTAVAAAEKLGRQWIGIDITHLAISLIKYRMQDMFPSCEFAVIGEPQDIGAAHQLALDNRYQFQWWALSLIRARPLGGETGSKVGKKGSDQGIDGVINFIDDAKGKPKRVLVQVKSGNVNAGDIMNLVGAITRENAPIGVFITLEPPTRNMTKEALSAGFYHSEMWQKDYPKIQILTIEDLLSGKQVEMPPDYGTFKAAQKFQKKEGKQGDFGI